ncbi:MAG: hypothetical protein FWB99_08960 [Treponema sp.]|nr:hypothetical protein [Treponema sp.]
MKLYAHFSANSITLQKMDFKRELAMEGYLIENEKILQLDEDDFGDVQIIDDELSVKGGRKNKDSDGRIDLLALYNNYGFGVIELKKSSLTVDNYKQLEDYFSENTKKVILEKHKDYFSHNEIKWIGILVGTDIEDDLKKMIEEGLLINDEIPVAGIVLKRFRCDKGQTYIITDVYFKPKKGKDYKKYTWNKNEYAKNRLVLAVVADYSAKTDNCTMNHLQETFPKKLQGSYGVMQDFTSAKKIYDDTNIKRHFIDDPITLQNGEKIAVCNEWNKDNIRKFIEKAKELGYTIS